MRTLLLLVYMLRPVSGVMRDGIGGEELNGVCRTLCGCMIFHRATVDGTRSISPSSEVARAPVQSLGRRS